MKKALIFGIDYYEHLSKLYGCAGDARKVNEILAQNSDETVNFANKLMTATDSNTRINRESLKDGVADLFSNAVDIALFYFAGHGHIESTGGYLLTPDSKRGDDGLPLGEVLALANSSKAKNKVIILDSCHSGIAGTRPGSKNTELSEGITILTASTADQYALEKNGKGLFTTLLIDALGGAAANLVGDITPSSVYAHIDQSLGPWEQRPVFKTNVKNFISLRKTQPPISLNELKKIYEFFPLPDFEFELDPTFEPEMKGRDPDMPKPIEKNTKIFGILQKYNRVNLLVPVKVPHMWNAAMESKACKLTNLGKHYHQLVKRGRI